MSIIESELTVFAKTLQEAGIANERGFSSEMIDSIDEEVSMRERHGLNNSNSKV